MNKASSGQEESFKVGKEKRKRKGKGKRKITPEKQGKVAQTLTTDDKECKVIRLRGPVPKVILGIAIEVIV